MFVLSKLEAIYGNKVIGQSEGNPKFDRIMEPILRL